MLEEPQNINEADNESIEELVKTFPYFAPARYMQAASQHKEEPFSSEMLSRMQLYTGNWLLYNEFLQDALGGSEVAFDATTTTEEAPVSEQEPVAEEIADEVQAPVADNSVAQQPVAQPAQEDIVEEEEPEPINTGFIRGKKKEASKPAPSPKEEVVPEAEPEASKAEEIERPEIKRPQQVPQTEEDSNGKKENLIPPVYTEDYFLHQGVHVSNDLPDDIGDPDKNLNIPDGEQSLMVVMSFSEWLMYYKKKKQQEQEEEEDQRALKSMWQKEKLAAALEEENEEIPENVFEMAVNSITKEESLASEALAEVMVKQGRYDRAIDMYKKLSLRKPQKKAYFARKIEEILKEQ